MKNKVIAALAVFLAFGCSSTTTKNIKVFVVPPDAVISVVSSPNLQGLQFHSPAALNLKVPKDPVLASKAFLEVREDAHKTWTISLQDIADGQTLNIRLEKVTQHDFLYRFNCHLISSGATDILQYRDNNIAVSFVVAEQSFQIRLENLV